MANDISPKPLLMMRNMIHRQMIHRQNGYSLMEVMIAMTLGLVISVGAITLFANTLLSTRTVNSAGQLQEAGAYLTQILVRSVRMTGYVDWLSSSTARRSVLKPSSATSQAYDHSTTAAAANGGALLKTVFNQDPLHGCAGSYATPSSLADSTCSPTPSPTAHAITVAYQVVSNPEADTAPSLPSGFTLKIGMTGDCTASSTSPQAFAVNRYYLKTDTAELMCVGNGGGVVPIASNVEQFVVQYGLSQSNALIVNATTGQRVAGDDESNDLMIARYVTADQMGADDWGKVIAVRMCFLIRGELNTATSVTSAPNQTSSRLDCVGERMALTSERRLRQAFGVTIALRNNIHTTP